MRELHLFAGVGGGILGAMLLGHTCVCAVEIKPYRRKVLLKRQRDGVLPRFPIWDDITTFDAQPWRGRVDAICGGFPCQDISCAGKGAGIEGKRSGLWKEFARVVREVGPHYVFVENSPMLTVRGLGHVLRDLAEMGFNARWGVFSAAAAGAPHIRERLFILANSQHAIMEERRGASDAWETGNRTNGTLRINDRSEQRQNQEIPSDLNGERKLQPEGMLQNFRGRTVHCDWWKNEPGVGRVVYGAPDGLVRNAGLGDAQVPQVARIAWETLDSMSES